jgi:hypothetical protein
MRSLACWIYLNLKNRLRPLPTDPANLEKIAKDLKVPLAFTYRAHGLNVALAQLRIYESLNSFRWSAPLVLAALSLVLMISCSLESLALVDFADNQEAD